MGHSTRSSSIVSYVRGRVRRIFSTLYPSFTLRREAFRPVSLLSMFIVLSLFVSGFYLMVPFAILPTLTYKDYHQVILLLSFLWTFFNGLLSYVLTAIADPGKIPSTWKPCRYRLERIDRPGIPVKHWSKSTFLNACADGSIQYQDERNNNSTNNINGEDNNNNNDSNTDTSTSINIDLDHHQQQNNENEMIVMNKNSNEHNEQQQPEVDYFPMIPKIVTDSNTSFLRNEDKRYRYCTQCKTFKPDRSHHCRQCSQCILQMDHHCPFTGNACIGYMNRKFFLLFLYYSCISCLLITFFTPKKIVSLLFNDELDKTIVVWKRLLFCISILVAYTMCCLNAAVLLPFSIFHTLLIFRNRTTIENMEFFHRNQIHLLKQMDIMLAQQHQQHQKVETQSHTHTHSKKWLHFVIVFGRYYWTWLLPITYGRSPLFDGMKWFYSLPPPPPSRPPPPAAPALPAPSAAPAPLAPSSSCASSASSSCTSTSTANNNNSNNKPVGASLV